MSSIETIDHVEVGTERLTYKLSQENVIKLLTIFLEKSQELEDEFILLANQKSIDLAEGIWLDYIGKIIGVSRDGLTDSEYRSALKFQIGVNTSDGTPNIIIDLVKEFTGSASVTISESGVAFATLSFNGDTNTGSGLYDLLQKIRPVGTRFLLHSDFYDNSLLLAYENNLSSAEVFQTTNDGFIFENFEVTLDGVNFEPLFTVTESQSYYSPSLVEGRNSWYYEEPEYFFVTSDGVNFETLELTSPTSTYPELKVVVPYIEGYIPENILPLWWEVNEDSLPIIGIGEEDMINLNPIYNLLSQDYTITVANIMVN